MTKRLLSLAFAAALVATPLLAAEYTGYITDTHCGKMAANKDHTADCVSKCMKGGAKAQILNEADGKVYNLDSFEKVKGMVGVKVTVKGTLDAKTNTIAVESAAAIE